MATRRVKSISEAEKKSVKINKAKPAPDFGKLHSQWQEKLQEGISKTKKPSTVPCGIPVLTKKCSKTPTALSSKKPSVRPPPSGKKAPPTTVGTGHSVRKRQTKAVEEIDDGFKADPDSLAAILDNKPVKEPLKTEQLPRLSIYEISALRSQQRRDDYKKSFSLYNPTRTPLRNVDNVLSNYTEKATPRRKSIYDMLGTNRKVITPAMSASEKRRIFNSESGKKVTWSTKLARSQNSESQDVGLKVKLFEDNETEDPNESLLQKIRLAEQRLEMEVQAMSMMENDIINATYVTRPNRNDSMAMFDDSPENVVSLLNDSPGCVQEATVILPAMSGVTRLAATPSNDDSISNLLSNLQLASQSQQLYASPILPIPTKLSAKMVSFQKMIPSKESESSPPLSEIKTAKFQEVADQLQESGEIVNDSKSLCTSANVSAVCTSADTSTFCIRADGSTIVSNHSQDSSCSVEGSENESAAVVDANTSPALCDTLLSVDELIIKSRRRSAALVAEPSVADSNLKHELERILAEQQMLEQRKREIEQKLVNVRSSYANSTNSNVSTASSSASKHEVEVEPICMQSPTQVVDTGVATADSSIVAGQVDNSTIDLSKLGDGEDISFMPLPSDMVDNQGLQAISTAAIKTARRTKVRESINLMLFSPTLGTICEQDTITNSQVSQKSTSTAAGTLIDITASETKDSSAVLIEKAPSLGSLDTSNSMDISESVPRSLEIYPPCSSSMPVDVPAFTPINHIQGSHLLTSGQQQVASISPATLHSQSRLIASIDCVQNGLSSGHHQQTLDKLELRHGVNRKQENSLLRKAIDNVMTPRIKCSAGTIKIYSCENSPLSTTALSTPDSSATPELYSSHKNKGLDTKTGERTPVIFRKKIVADKYRQALLDDEVAIYMCTAMTSSIGERRRDLRDPVAYNLEHGDFQHFIPISAEGARDLLPMEGSAFSVLSS